MQKKRKTRSPKQEDHGPFIFPFLTSLFCDACRGGAVSAFGITSRRSFVCLQHKKGEQIKKKKRKPRRVKKKKRVLVDFCFWIRQSGHLFLSGTFFAIQIPDPRSLPDLESSDSAVRAHGPPPWPLFVFCTRTICPCGPPATCCVPLDAWLLCTRRREGWWLGAVGLRMYLFPPRRTPKQKMPKKQKNINKGTADNEQCGGLICPSWALQVVTQLPENVAKKVPEKEMQQRCPCALGPAEGEIKGPASVSGRARRDLDRRGKMKKKKISCRVRDPCGIQRGRSASLSVATASTN